MKSRTLLILVVLLIAAAIALYALGPGRGVQPPAEPEETPIRGEPPEAPEAPVPEGRPDDETDIDELGEPVDPPDDTFDDLPGDPPAAPDPQSEPQTGNPTAEPRAGEGARTDQASADQARSGNPPSPATGPDDGARTAVEARQALFRLMGWSMEPLGAMLRNRIPFDAETVAVRATRLEQLGRMLPALFETDTRGTDVPTAARAGIWRSSRDFGDKADTLVRAAQGLRTAAESGERAATLRATGTVGQACGACHDAYRDD